MDSVSRRAALGFAVTGAAISSGALLYSAPAETYGADEGQELAPGVRRVELGKSEAIIPGAKAGLSQISGVHGSLGLAADVAPPVSEVAPDPERPC